MIKVVNDAMDKMARLKTQQIEEKIESSKKLKESAKIGLKYLWTKLISEAKVKTLTKMMEAKIIETAESVKLLQGAFEKEDEKNKVKAKEANTEIKKSVTNTGQKPESEEAHKKRIADTDETKKGKEL